MPQQRQVRAAPRYQPLRRIRPQQAPSLDMGDSLATILLGGAAGIAGKALEQAADEERQRLTITGEIEGVGAGHAAAMAGQPLPESDITSYYGGAFSRGARTGYATALNNKITLDLDAAATAAGEDLQAFDRTAAKIAGGFALLPPDLRAAAEISLSERGREYRGQIEAALAKRQAEAQEFTSRQALRLHGERAQQAALAGDEAKAEMARREHHASVAALIGRGMSADEATATIQRVDYEIEEQRALGGFNRAARGGAAQAYAYVGALGGDAKAFSTPDTRTRVLRTLEGQLNTIGAEQRRREAAAEKAKRQTEDATFKRAMDLHASGGLTMDWVQRNRAGLSASDYGQLTRAATEPRPARTDPVTYADLEGRARSGENVKGDVKRAFIEGRLTRENYDALNGVVERGEDDALKEGHGFIRRFVMGTEFSASHDQSQRYATAVREYEDWAAQRRGAGQPPLTRAEANTAAERIARAWATTKPGDVVGDPQFLIRDPKGAFDANATRAATRAAMEAGRLTPSQAAEEARRIGTLEERERQAREAAEQLKAKGVR